RIGGLALVALWSWTLLGAWRHVRWKGVSVDVLGRYLVFGAPLAVALLATSLRVAGNRYVVMSLTGSESTGLFSAAVNIGGAPLVIFQQIVMLGLYPLAIDAWEAGEDYRPIVRDGLRWFMLGGLPALTGLALLARPVLAVVAGPEYAAAWPALSLVAGGMFLYGLSQYFSLKFIVAKRTAVMAAVGLSAAAVNIGLSLYLVPRHGYLSAAYSTLVANAVMLAASMIWGIRPERVVLPLRTAWRSVLAAAAMAFVLGGLMRVLTIDDAPRLALAVLIGAGTYFLVIWRTGEIDVELREAGRWSA
ncbi:polysaccharide biosynthesis C-terminal domain-containing protein, partial [bacterium]|nr:polysaccharide biosynthesis C-terminal domain-containing protein [bacterium]